MHDFMKLAYYPLEGLDPSNGYGRNGLGLMGGLVKAGVEFDLSADTALILGFASRLKYPAFRDYEHLILYTMSESTAISDEWVYLINKYASRVFVPCPELVDIYRSCGVRRPVDVVYHGVDVFGAVTPNPRPESPPFRFLTYSLGDHRKGAELVMFAFDRLYKDNPDYQLVVKTIENTYWK